MPKTLARQRRREEHVVQAPIEVRTSPDGKVGIRGYAAVFDAESWGEVIKRGAFKRTLTNGGNIDLLINHEGLPIATTKAGTLTVTVDERGLLVDAPDLDITNPTVQELVSVMGRGDVDKMSFAGIFHDALKIDGLREVREVELWDVSIVTRPWYDETEVGLRSLLLQRRSAGQLNHEDRRALAQASLEIGAGYRKLTERAAPAGKTSWGDIIDDIWTAVAVMCDDYVYIADIGDDWVVYGCWDDTDVLYQSAWSMDDNGVVTVEPGAPVTLTYVPAGDPAAAASDEPDPSMSDTAERNGMSLTLAQAYVAAGRIPV